MGNELTTTLSAYHYLRFLRYYGLTPLFLLISLCKAHH